MTQGASAHVWWQLASHITLLTFQYLFLPLLRRQQCPITLFITLHAHRFTGCSVRLRGARAVPHAWCMAHYHHPHAASRPPCSTRHSTGKSLVLLHARVCEPDPAAWLLVSSSHGPILSPTVLTDTWAAGVSFSWPSHWSGTHSHPSVTPNPLVSVSGLPAIAAWVSVTCPGPCSCE